MERVGSLNKPKLDAFLCGLSEDADGNIIAKFSCNYIDHSIILNYNHRHGRNTTGKIDMIKEIVTELKQSVNENETVNVIGQIQKDFLVEFA